ncbi:NUDIX domain-containing protein [Micromonospora tulbaghiae]
MGQNVPMTISADGPGRVRIVTAVLRDGDRVLLCHRSAGRRHYPDVWDLPGGHVEEGEAMDMQIWFIDSWTGTPVNAAPDEHDAVAWFEASDLAGLRLAHEPLLPVLTAVLASDSRPTSSARQPRTGGSPNLPPRTTESVSTSWTVQT